MNDLSVYAPVAARVVALGAEDKLIISAADFPDTLDDHSPFDGLVIDTSHVRSLGWAGGSDLPFEVMDRTRGFDAFALPEGYRRFGLWLLHFLFSGREWAGLELTHPTSRSRWFYVHVQRPEADRYSGLQSAGPERYSAYIHRPARVSTHPFAGYDAISFGRLDSEHDRPFFAFGWSDGDVALQWDISRADQLIYEATPKGIAAMAGLMLDFPHETLGGDEINMEPAHVGYDATQPRSIQARFWLPGSFGFPEDSLDDIRLRPFA